MAAAAVAEAAGPLCGMRRLRRTCKIHCSTAHCSPRCIRRLVPYRRAGLRGNRSSALQVNADKARPIHACVQVCMTG